MKKHKNTTLSEQFQKYNGIIVETVAKSIPLTHDHSLYCLDTAASITSGGVKLALWVEASPVSEMKHYL